MKLKRIFTLRTAWAGAAACAGAVLCLIAGLALAGCGEWQVETTDLTELSVAGVHEGDAARVTFDALPDLTLPGKVTHVKNFGQDHQGDTV